MKVAVENEWYFPHFGVQNPNKPEKLMIVFDAEADTEGESLNSTLMSGPDEWQTNFRKTDIGLCADEIFYQVMIREEDWPAHRTPWMKSSTDDIKVYEMQVMSFGANCSPASAECVKHRDALEYEQTFR